MDEDMIIPDEMQETATPQAEETIEPQQEEVIEETPSEELPQEQTEVTEEKEPFKIPIKYNHEEKELTLEEATPLIQKGMNYDKVIEKLKSLETDPRLSFVEQQAKKYNMTPDEYIEAVKQQEEQDQLKQLIEANIPEDIAREMLENRKFREQFKEQEKEKQEKAALEAKQTAELEEFIEAYPDLKPEDVPKEVYEYRNKTGKSMLQAMMWHENQQLKNKLKVLETNLNNKSKAPVNSITSHGSVETASEDDFLKGFNSF